MTVGFAPATVPVTGAPAATATATGDAGQSAGAGGLFASLLALLAPGAGNSPTDITLPNAATPALTGLTEATRHLPEDLQTALAATAGRLGIDLSGLDDLLADIETASDTPIDPDTFVSAVGSLVETLAAIAGDPTETGKTDGTATPGEGKLEAAVDALLALIGTPLPTPAPEPTTGEAFSEVVGELTAALTGSSKPSDEAPLPATPVAPAVATDPTLPLEEDAPDAPAPAAAAAPKPDGTEKPVGEATRPPLVERLAQLLDDTAKSMATTNPQLAEKLETLAKSLPTLPDKVLASLEQATTDAAGESTPELASLIEQATRPRQSQRPAPASAFTAPRLDLPAPDDKTAGPLGSQTDAAAKAPAPVQNAPISADIDTTPASSGSIRNDAPAPAAKPAAPTDSPAEPVADKPVETAQSPASSASAQQAPATPPVAVRAVQAAYQQPSTPIPLPQVAFEIVRQVQAGNSRFQIRLDPAELGRIDVQLDVDRSGNVSARMVVDRPETLDLMQRDQRALQQALQQAGLDSSRTNLEFSLRQNPFGGDGSNQGQNNNQGGRGTGNLPAGDRAPDPITEVYRGSAASGALNLFV